MTDKAGRWGCRSDTEKRVVSTTIQRHFYRAGLLREELPLRNGRRHGVHRTWHKNGLLASEEPYQIGLLHGICRQWDEAGRLLGKYKMVRGTGIQRAWHDNGQLQMEVSTVRGEFCGRNRIWLRDGTLLSERFYLHGRVVSADEYRQTAAKDKTLTKNQAPSQVEAASVDENEEKNSRTQNKTNAVRPKQRMKVRTQ